MKKNLLSLIQINNMKKVLLILLLILCLPICVQATEVGKLGEKQQAEISNLYDYISNVKTKYEIFNDMQPRTFVEQFMKTGESGFSFKETSSYIIKYTFKEVFSSMELIGSLMIIALICALLNNLQSAFSKENLSNIAYFACYAVMIIMITKSFYIVVELAKNTIVSMSNFMSALIPVLMMLLASVGGFAEATLLDPVIMGFATVSSKIYVDIIIPIIFMSFVLQFVSNISSDYNKKFNEAFKTSGSLDSGNSYDSVYCSNYVKKHSGKNNRSSYYKNSKICSRHICTCSWEMFI